MTNLKDLEHFSEKNKSWLYYALLSAVGYGLLSFFQFIIIRKKTVSSISLAMFIALGQAIFGIIIYILGKYNFIDMKKEGIFKNYNKDLNSMMSKDFIGYSGGGALLNIIGLVTLLIGYIYAPNPGFSDAISDGYIIPQAILSYFIFGVNMNGLQIIGAVLAVFGMTLLSI